MDKQIITYEQADKISEWEYNTGHPGRLLKLHAKNKLSKRSECLQSLSLDQLARAIYVGYEVEEKFEVGGFVVNMHDGTVLKVINKITESGTYYEVVRCGSGLKESIHRDRLRHATPTEIAEEEKRRMDKKINEIWIGLSDYERNGLYKKLVRGDY